MSKFKHDLLLRLIKLVDAVLMTIPFALCWDLYYSYQVFAGIYTILIEPLHRSIRKVI